MQLYIADVRKRLNADANFTPHAVPESRNFSTPADHPAPADTKIYDLFLAAFSQFAPETPDDPIACPIHGCGDVTMEWTAGPSEGQIDFYAPASSDDAEPERFLTLHILSGLDRDEDRRIMKRLESYADFSQCLQFPLILTVVQDPLSDARLHQYLQTLRPAFPALAASFLKTYFAASTTAIS